MPVLLRALRVDDLALQRVTLETLSAHAQDAAPALGAHISSLVSAALALATRVAPRTGVRPWAPGAASEEDPCMCANVVARPTVPR